MFYPDYEEDYRTTYIKELLEKYNLIEGTNKNEDESNESVQKKLSQAQLLQDLDQNTGELVYITEEEEHKLFEELGAKGLSSSEKFGSMKGDIDVNVKRNKLKEIIHNTYMNNELLNLFVKSKDLFSRE